MMFQLLQSIRTIWSPGSVLDLDCCSSTMLPVQVESLGSKFHFRFDCKHEDASAEAPEHPDNSKVWQHGNMEVSDEATSMKLDYWNQITQTGSEKLDYMTDS